MADKINLFDLDREAMTAWFIDNGEKPFRAKQLLKWIYHERVTDFDAMTDLSKPLREKLKTSPNCASRPSSPTKPPATAHANGFSATTAATASKPSSSRKTTAAPSASPRRQAAPLACPFCSTGHAGFNRNLTTGEIIVQVWLAKELLN